MARPVLVLQYPDRQRDRTVALASTRDWEALMAFKRAVLGEARLAALTWQDDDVLRVNGQAEVHRLETLLEELIPENEDSEEAADETR